MNIFPIVTLARKAKTQKTNNDYVEGLILKIFYGLLAYGVIGMIITLINQ